MRAVTWGEEPNHCPTVVQPGESLGNKYPDLPLLPSDLLLIPLLPECNWKKRPWEPMGHGPQRVAYWNTVQSGKVWKVGLETQKQITQLSWPGNSI